MVCMHCGSPIERAPSYLGVPWQHVSGYQHCWNGGTVLDTKAAPASMTGVGVFADGSVVI